MSKLFILTFTTLSIASAAKWRYLLGGQQHAEDFKPQQHPLEKFNPQLFVWVSPTNQNVYYFKPQNERDYINDRNWTGQMFVIDANTRQQHNYDVTKNPTDSSDYNWTSTNMQQQQQPQNGAHAQQFPTASPTAESVAYGQIIDDIRKLSATDPFRAHEAIRHSTLQNQQQWLYLMRIVEPYFGHIIRDIIKSETTFGGFNGHIQTSGITKIIENLQCIWRTAEILALSRHDCAHHLQSLQQQIFSELEEFHNFEPDESIFSIPSGCQ